MVNKYEQIRTHFAGVWIGTGTRRTTVLACLVVASMVLADRAPGQSQTLPDTLSGTFDLNATSGQATINGDSELTDDVTLDMRFLVDYLVVAGGGGGGVSRGGGGGAGGLLTNVGGYGYSITPQSYTVIVGAGGAGQPGGFDGGGANGVNSTFATITADGGGGGGGNAGGVGVDGKDGGSGGGARPTSTYSASGGVRTAGQGHDGGNAVGGAGGGGGGGAGSAGSGGGSSNAAGAGGDGVSSAISGTAMPYAAGGGGAGNPATSHGAGGSVNGTTIGGEGGGGNAAASTGSGGGGNWAGTSAGGNGAAGIVIVRYAGDSAGTGGTQSVIDVAGVDYQVHQFTTSNQLETLNTSLDFSGLDLNDRLGATLSGNLSGSGGLTYAGPGKLTLTGTNSYTGATTISAGTLALGGTGSMGSPTIDIASGATFDVSAVTNGFTLGPAQTLTGSGTAVGPMAIEGTISPGQSPGTLFTDDQSWAGGGKYAWEINSAGGTAGADPGWDLISMAELAMTATESTPFTVEVHSLAFDNEAGVVFDFVSAQGYSWKIASTTGITGWDVADGLASGLFSIDADSFGNSLPDSAGWSVSKMGNDVFLNYIPEPSAVVLLACALVLVLGRRRRQVRYGQ